jgi:protein PhnA
MGKGYDENQERLAVLQSFGKELARRAKSTCELSLAKGVALQIYEVPPVGKGAELERCLFLSEDTIAGLGKPSLLVADDWRHLGELIWSEMPLQQVRVYRILRYLAKDHDWCAGILEEAYLDDEVVAAAEAVPLG